MPAKTFKNTTKIFYFNNGEHHKKVVRKLGNSKTFQTEKLMYQMPKKITKKTELNTIRFGANLIKITTKDQAFFC